MNKVKTLIIEIGGINVVFSSPLFLFVFIPLFFSAYFLTVPKYRNIVALIGSLLFYAWGGPSFLGILLFSLLVDWHIVNAMYRAKESLVKKRYFVIALILNISLLVYFKYANFFLSNLNDLYILLHIQPMKWAEILLPIGISFIVFHKISYIIEVYRNEKEPMEKVSDYFLYILLFPMSIAGPIIKFHDISDQIKHRDTTFNDILYGTFRFSIGLFKKVWIADNLALVADKVFGAPTNDLNFGYAWIGVLCYAFQIYFDFSGYADMAIGLSRIMGFKVMENFNMPYISQSITEFWRRWHISLSSWMRNYLYFPLGGNRLSPIRNYFNLWVVFLVSGLWHGANWTFVVWGIFHGILIVLDKLFWLKTSSKLPKFLNITITFILVLIAWVFFRADTFHHAVSYIKVMFDLSQINRFSYIKYLFFTNNMIFTIILAFFITFIPATKLYNQGITKYERVWSSELFRMILIFFLLSFSIVKCVTSSFSPFIYFRF